MRAELFQPGAFTSSQTRPATASGTTTNSRNAVPNDMGAPRSSPSSMVMSREDAATGPTAIAVRAKDVTKRIPSGVGPTELMHGISGGTEAAVHTVRALLALNPSWVVCKTDIQNAFNAVCRKWVLAAAQTYPTLVPLAKMIYGDTTKVVYDNSGDPLEIMAAMGVTQGDPLASILYSTALRHAVDATLALHKKVVIVGIADNVVRQALDDAGELGDEGGRRAEGSQQHIDRLDRLEVRHAGLREGGHVRQDGILIEVVFDHLRHEGVHRLVIRDAGADGVGNAVEGRAGAVACVGEGYVGVEREPRRRAVEVGKLDAVASRGSAGLGAAGVAELDRRVAEATDYACRQLGIMYPDARPDQRMCERETLTGTEPQLLVARATR